MKKSFFDSTIKSSFSVGTHGAGFNLSKAIVGSQFFISRCWWVQIENTFHELFYKSIFPQGFIVRHDKKKEQILRHTSHCIHDESLDRLISSCRRFTTCRTDWESLFAPTWSQYCTHFRVYTPHILLKDVLLHWSIVSITLSLNPSSARACCCNELPLSSIVLPAGVGFPSGFLKGRNNSSLSTSIAMGSSHRVFASNKPGLCWPEGDHCYGFGLVWS